MKVRTYVMLTFRPYKSTITTTTIHTPTDDRPEKKRFQNSIFSLEYWFYFTPWSWNRSKWLWMCPLNSPQIWFPRRRSFHKERNLVSIVRIYKISVCPISEWRLSLCLVSIYFSFLLSMWMLPLISILLFYCHVLKVLEFPWSCFNIRWIFEFALNCLNTLLNYHSLVSSATKQITYIKSY